MSLILHLNTSGNEGYYFLATAGAPVASPVITAKDHAALLPGAVSAVLEQHGITLAQIDAVAVCNGPGSYTGLRVGLSAAKGFCYALNKPLILLHRLFIICRHLLRAEAGAGGALAVLPARPGEYFAAALSQNGDPLLMPGHFHTEDLISIIINLNHSSPLIAGGEGLTNDCIALLRLPSYTDCSDGQALSEAAASYAGEQYAAGNFAETAYCEPYYLKDAFATQPNRYSKPVDSTIFL